MSSRSSRASRAARGPVRPSPPHRPAPAKTRRGLPSNPANDPARVGVRELRQNLSVYLDRVKAGETLTVTEHGAVVARLAPVRPGSGLERLVADGRARPPQRPTSGVPAPRVAPARELSSESVLAELRGGRQS